MNHQAIINDIRAKKYSPIYFLHGTEPYFIDAIMKEADGILTDAEKSFNQVVMYGKDTSFKQVVDQAAQYPMMSSHRVVILKEAQYMSDFDGLANYFERPSPQTCLFISYKKKIDGRKKIFSKLKKSSVFFKSDPIKDWDVPKWISNYVQANKRLIHPDNAQRLSDLLGNNLGKITNELDKLFVSVPEGKQITDDNIHENVGLSKDYNIFEFQNAISARDTHKAFQIVDYFGRNTKDNPVPMILGSMYGYWSKVFTAKANAKLDNRALAAKLKVFSPNVAAGYKTAARHYSVPQIYNAFDALLEADKAFKGVSMRQATPNEVLETMTMRMFYG